MSVQLFYHYTLQDLGEGGQEGNWSEVLHTGIVTLPLINGNYLGTLPQLGKFLLFKTEDDNSLEKRCYVP